MDELYVPAHELTVLQNKIEAVLSLHRREEDEEDPTVGWCTHCASFGDAEDWQAISWPCETARLLT